MRMTAQPRRDGGQRGAVGVGSLVQIVDPAHPHYPETGRLTGQMIRVLGSPMAEVTLDSCRHGTGGCFVGRGQAKAILEPS